MTSECGVCGRPTPDNATICPRDAYTLDAALADVSGYQGLAWDLDLATTRQTRMATRNGGRATETPVMFNKQASAAAAELKNTLAGWARLIIDETGVGTTITLGPACRLCQHTSCREIRTRGLPADTLPGIAAWLRPRVGWLRHHEAGAEAHDQILDAVREARQAIDRPADKLYAGPCDECGRDLYANLDASYVRCGNAEGHEGGDEWVWSVEERRRWLLDSAEDVLATTTEISRALTRYARPVTPEAIRGYKARGQLAVKGERPVSGRKDPVPLYRLGDVLDILARQAEKVAS